MTKNSYKYIYGPVSSWRLGLSLGIDLLAQEGKACNLDCIYCQLGRKKKNEIKRRIYAPTDEVLNELRRLGKLKVDYITFSGMGEPTLAKNLGQTIKRIKKIRKEPIAILTNSSLIDREAVRRELSLADFVIAKIDAYSQESFERINRPYSKIRFNDIVEGIKKFKKQYRGRLALQIMFIKENKERVKELADLADCIGPNEIQINTPLRPCPVMPLSKEEIFKIKRHFFTKCRPDKKKIDIISAYDARPRKKAFPISHEETRKRRALK